MQVRMMVGRAQTEGVDFAGLDLETLATGLKETEAPPPSGAVPRAAAAWSTEQGRLEVATVPDVVLDGVSLELSRLHNRILAALIEGPGPVSTSRLASIVWQGRPVSEHTIHSQIGLLRGRMADFGVRIKNVRGRGYVLD